MKAFGTSELSARLRALSLQSQLVHFGLRLMIVLGFAVRLVIHPQHYSISYLGFTHRAWFLTAMVVYAFVTTSLWKFLKSSPTSSRNPVDLQVAADCMFIAVAYWMTGQVESDFHLAFIVPLIAAMRTMRPGSVLFALVLIGFTLILGMVGAVHVISAHEGMIPSRKFTELAVSVFAPRVAFWCVTALICSWLIAAHELAAQEQLFYRSLVDTIPQKVFRKDLNLRFTYASPGFATTLELGPDDLVGKTDCDLYPTDLAKKYQDDDKRLLQVPGETIDKIEEHQDKATGSRTLVHVIKRPIVSSAGRAIGIQGLFWNVETRDIEHSKMLAWFLHDTPKPLHLIRDNYLEQIRFAQQKRDERFLQIPHYCDKIDDVIRFVSAQFQAYGILGGSRFEWVSQDSIRVEKLFSSLSTIVRLNEANVTIKLVNDTGDVKFKSDAFKLTAVFWVLTDNAVKAIRRRCGNATAQGRIRVECRLVESKLGMIVTDDGCGFTSEEKLKMKKGATGQADVSSGFGSTGFGLRIIERFSSLGNGTWECESSGPNSGAKFEFWVPVTRT